MSTTRAGMLLILLGIFASGCNLLKKKGAGTDAGTDAGGLAANDAGLDGGATGSAPPPEDVLLGRKMNPYVVCSNKFTNEINRTRGFYLHVIDPKKGPNGTEGKVDLQTMASPKECLEGIAKGKALEPRKPSLETAGDAYGNALATLEPLLKEGHEYYSQGNNKDDKAAKGKKLHPQLMAAWKGLFDSAKLLDVELTALEEEIQVKKIARFEKDKDAQLYFHHENTLYRAKKVVEVASQAKLPADLDLAKYGPVLEAFEKAEQGFKTYADAHKAEVDGVGGLDSWLRSDTDSFHKTAKELLRRKRDKVKFDSGERMFLGPDMKGNTVIGTPANVIYVYNSFIESSNRLRWK